MSKNKVCIFCNRTYPEVKMSKEHIIRKKFRKLLGLGGIAHHWEQKIVNQSTGSIEPLEKRIPQSPYETTLNKVCKECNESWLNDIENNVEHLLVSLALNNQEIRGTIEDSKSLALWSYKTSVIKAKADTIFNPIPESYYLWVKDKQEPAPYTFIYLFKCESAPDNFFIRNLPHTVSLGNHHQFDCHQTTILLGKMLIYVLGFNKEVIAESVIDVIENKITPNSYVRVWPNPNAINWSFLPMHALEELPYLTTLFCSGPQENERLIELVRQWKSKS
ncbi:hypothetical protein [Vibrio parahaemolyticus]|uniref:hypothetical protein n=1 Tax=Vibrio parahaemolyticus TaxID=670 RepID=UPI002B1F71D4|nr:hypothetical protein [Vibrio parahaemolyticus]